MNVNREVAAPSRFRPKWSAAIAALVLAGLVVHGIVERHDNVIDLKSVADEESVVGIRVDLVVDDVVLGKVRGVVRVEHARLRVERLRGGSVRRRRDGDVWCAGRELYRFR